MREFPSLIISNTQNSTNLELSLVYQSISIPSKKKVKISFSFSFFFHSNFSFIFVCDVVELPLWMKRNCREVEASYCLIMALTKFASETAESSTSSFSKGAGRLRSMKLPPNLFGGILTGIELPDEYPVTWDLLCPPRAWPEEKTLKQTGHSWIFLSGMEEFVIKSSLVWP